MLAYFEGGPETASGEYLDDLWNERRLSVDDANPPQNFALPYVPQMTSFDLTALSNGRAQYSYRGRATRHDPETGTWAAIAVYRYLRDVESNHAGQGHNWKHEGF